MGGAAVVLYCLLLGKCHLAGEDEYIYKEHSQQCSRDQDSQKQQIIGEQLTHICIAWIVILYPCDQEKVQ